MPIYDQVKIKGRVRRRRVVWWSAAAAAVVLVVIAVGSYFTSGRSIVDWVPADNRIVTAPTGVHAFLTLADGKKIALDSVGEGRLGLVRQGNMDVVKTADGQVAYMGPGSRKMGVGTNGSAGPELVYNSISNPRGSKVVTLTLSDGTRVWLNNETTIRYPVNFPADERKVDVTGEAYFEVAGDPQRKFLVTSKDFTTEVLGTHFNIKSFPKEDDNYISLLEGKVMVTAAGTGRSAVMTPGQQADITRGGGWMEMKPVEDMRPFTAWKDGKFYFMGATLQTVMNELSRWYDLNVEYDVKVRKQFTGIISRNVTAQEVFAMLEQTSDIKFTVDGKRVMITKKKR